MKSVKELQKSSLNGSLYSFQKMIQTSEEGLIHNIGNPVRFCGLVKSGFKPSDTVCIFPFNIPTNILLGENLRNLSKLLISKGILLEV